MRLNTCIELWRLPFMRSIRLSREMIKASGLPEL